MSVKTFPVIVKYRFGWLMMLILVALFVFGMVTGLTNSIWRLSSSWLLPMGLCAITAGWYTGGAKRNVGIAFGIGIIAGIVILILIQSGAYLDFSRAFSETQQIQIIYTPLTLNPPNTDIAAYQLFSAVNNLNVYFSELSQWFLNLVQRKAVSNLTAINLIWGSLLWSVLFAMGWLLRHQTHAFLASLPALILLGGVIGYTRRETSGLIITLGAIFVMIIFTELLKREHRWEIQHVDYSEEIRFDIITYSVPVLVLILALANFIPSISFDNIRSLLNLQNRLASGGQASLPTSLGLDQAPLDPIAGLPQSGMPRSHLIGSGVELSELKIMEISPGEYYLPPQFDPGAQAPSYYWFGHAFEIYTGTGWKTGEFQQEIIPADQQIFGDEWTPNNVVKLTIRKSDDASSTLYFTGALVSVNRTVTIITHQDTGEYLYGQITTKHYLATTAVYDFSEDQLSQSSTSPPEFILETYLDLPRDIPERVIELANNLTDQALTPYNKAKSIETYLRQFEYTLDLPTPPQDRDIVDYFLFDLQRGYCDYYASAMVVLARLSGLPARLVVGYGPGTYDYTQQKFIITEANAHAWPEIYLEPFGWVPFEPTASFTPRVWDADSDSESAMSPVSPEDASSDELPTVHAAWLLPLLLISVAGVLWLILRSKRNKTTTIAQIESIYQSTRAHLTQVFFKLNIEHTPQEFRRTYSDFLQANTNPGYTRELSHRFISHLTNIVNLYELGVYSPHKIFADQVEQVRKDLFYLRIQSWLLRAAHVIKKS